MKKIVIVGGGSAGWMSAAMMIKTFPDKEIVLVESESINKIGVGESTYEGINYFLEYLEIDRNSFFKYTDATVKVAIQFKNFYKENDNTNFIYPFGVPVLHDNLRDLDDWMIRKALKKDIPITDFAESYFPAAHLVKYNRLSDNIDKNLDNFHPVLNTALHFDAIKFSEWLKNNYCIPNGVKNIINTVNHIEVNDKGIEYLLLNNNEKIYADLFIDCTGFESLLLDKTLKEEFIFYNNLLPNTNAWATQIQYKDPEVELENVTRCTALKNGWCWNIPLYSRLGAGYVYSDKYTTHEKALEEFKYYLSEQLIIPRNSDEINSLKFKNIKMRVGIHKRTWVKNVVAIGLSAGFIEPLESNGLFTVHEFLFHLVKCLQREGFSQWDRDVYNSSTKKTYDDFVNFIRLHYALSLRQDSDYWKDNLNKTYESDLLPDTINHLSYLKSLKMEGNNNPIHSGIPWISVGMNYLFFDQVAFKQKSIRYGKINNFELEKSFNNLDKRKNKWENAVLKEKTSYRFIKDKYHMENGKSND